MAYPVPPDYPSTEGANQAWYGEAYYPDTSQVEPVPAYPRAQVVPAYPSNLFPSIIIKDNLEKLRNSQIKNIAVEIIKFLAQSAIAVISPVFLIPATLVLGVGITVGAGLSAIGSLYSLINSINQLIKTQKLLNEVKESMVTVEERTL